jgi:hypothetical protein
VPSARELLDQADALMRRNRLGPATVQGRDPDIPTLMDAVPPEAVVPERRHGDPGAPAAPVHADAPLAEVRGGANFADARAGAPGADDDADVTSAAAAEAADPPTISTAAQDLDDVPLLTDIVEEIEAPSILEEPADDPGTWSDTLTGTHSVLDAPQRVAGTTQRPPAADHAPGAGDDHDPLGQDTPAQQADESDDALFFEEAIEIVPPPEPQPAEAATTPEAPAWMAAPGPPQPAAPAMRRDLRDFAPSDEPYVAAPDGASGEMASQTITEAPTSAHLEAPIGTFSEAPIEEASAAEPIDLEAHTMPLVTDNNPITLANFEPEPPPRAGAEAAAEFATPFEAVGPTEGDPAMQTSSVAPTPAPAASPAASPAAASAEEEARWTALAEEIRMQVLQRIDLFTDTGLREQLAARLQPIVDRAGADLVATINQHVGVLLRAYVAEAIEREIERWRSQVR